MRELRITVAERLAPITDLANAEQLRKNFMEILDCHHWLYDVAEITYHDISAQNLMIRPDSEQGHYGVLNDFDLALDLNVEPSARNRTGTRPFMALDLLKEIASPPKQIYRHDLESFYWLLLWIACRYPSSEFTAKGAQKPFEDWLTLDQRSLYNAKTIHLMDTLHLDLTETFCPIDAGLMAIHMMLTSGRTALRDNRIQRKYPELTTGVAEPNFDDDTLGGRVTYDNFRRYLQI